MGLWSWVRKFWQAMTRRSQPKRQPVRRGALGIESLEARETPAAFIYLLAGFNAPVGNNGMTFLGRELQADPMLSEHLTVLDWQRTGFFFDRPVLPVQQREYVTARIRDDLTRNQASASDQVILIGHSFGGFLAHSLASKVPGLSRAANSLITIDPIDPNRALALKPQLNQAGVWLGLPGGLRGTNVLNFVQRSSILQGFSISGAMNNSVLAKGADDRWGTADDSEHYLIDSDLGRDNRRLGIYDTIKNALHALVGGGTSGIYSRTTQPAPQALWNAIRRQFPFATTAQLYRYDAAPDTFPELYAAQGRSVAITLAPFARGITITPFRTSLVGPEIQISGRVLGWGESALGYALFRTLKNFSTQLGIERLQWNGRIWTAGSAAEVEYRGAYPSNRFFVGFSLDGARALDATVLSQFMQDLRSTWSEEMQLHAGWPVLAVRSLASIPEPWIVQPVIRPESDLANPTRLGRFTTTARIGAATTLHGTPFSLAFFSAGQRMKVDDLYFEGRTMWILPFELFTPDWRPWRYRVTRANRP